MDMEEQLRQPALATPPGVVSHFPDTSSDLQVAYYPAVIFVAVMPGILFVVRIYTKLRIVGRLDLTDLMLSLAWPFFITLLVAGWGVVSNGGGAHQWNLRNADFVRVAYYYYLIEIIYCPCMFFVKAAILLQYQRTFSPRRSISPFMWWSTWAIIVVTGIFYLLSTFLTTFGCNPREAAWNPLIVDAKCLDNDLLVVITSLFNMLSDIIILLLPARAVWQLQIPTRKKVGVVALFALGLLACISNGLIIFYFMQASGPAETADITYYVSRAGFWGYAEIAFGIIVSSAILLPKFFNAKIPVFQKYWSSFSRPFSSLGQRGSGDSKVRTTSGSDNSEASRASRKDRSAMSDHQRHGQVNLTTLSSKSNGGEVMESVRVTADIESSVSGSAVSLAERDLSPGY